MAECVTVFLLLTVPGMSRLAGQDWTVELAGPWLQGLPLSWDGNPTLIPAHIVVGGSKTDLAEVDWFLAILAVVAWWG